MQSKVRVVITAIFTICPSLSCLTYPVFAVQQLCHFSLPAPDFTLKFWWGHYHVELKITVFWQYLEKWGNLRNSAR